MPETLTDPELLEKIQTDPLKAYQKRWREANKRTRQHYATGYWKENKIALRNYRRQWQQHFREEVFRQMGGACACCGETALPFLQIDHIVPPPTHIRVQTKSYGLLKKVRDSGYARSLYRILCSNCNFATRFSKVCPHQTEMVQQFWQVCQEAGTRGWLTRSN